MIYLAQLVNRTKLKANIIILSGSSVMISYWHHQIFSLSCKYRLIAKSSQLQHAHKIFVVYHGFKRNQWWSQPGSRSAAAAIRISTDRYRFGRYICGSVSLFMLQGIFHMISTKFSKILILIPVDIDGYYQQYHGWQPYLLHLFVVFIYSRHAQQMIALMGKWN